MSREARSSERIARAFIAASEAGAFPEGLCSPEMTAWTTLQPEHGLADYANAIAWMREKTGGTLKFVVEGVTAEEDRVVIEARSKATLINGEPYANTYVFILRIRDGQIASVREHYNAVTVMEKLVPLMAG